MPVQNQSKYFSLYKDKGKIAKKFDFHLEEWKSDYVWSTKGRQLYFVIYNDLHASTQSAQCNRFLDSTCQL